MIYKNINLSCLRLASKSNLHISLNFSLSDIFPSCTLHD
nr:MAG TPA: hypothetical protein [Caudoviricetes sp.]